MDNPIDRRQFGRLSRRELLKLSPLILFGGFAWPAGRDILLAAGAFGVFGNHNGFEIETPIVTQFTQLTFPASKRWRPVPII